MRRAPSIALVLSLAAPATAQPPQAPAPTPAPAPAPPSTPPPSAAPAPAAPAEPLPPGADGPAPVPAPPAPGAAPPGYFVDGPAPPSQPPGPPTYEPPPPGFGPVFEPPPPPVARHVAPNTSLWAGVRLGWFLPFGYVYAENMGAGAFRRIPWDWYAGSGLMLEGDVGVRLGRNYTVFALWERAQLTSGDHYDDVFGGQSGADSDFWALGFQASSDADTIGFVTELALGYRQARTTWEDGTEMRFTDAWLEGRIGFGASIRLSPMLSITPMLTLGVGSFGDIDRVYPDGASANVVHAADAADSHGWLTLGIGGHVDLFGQK